VTFIVYGIDKYNAIEHRSRIRIVTLLGMDLYYILIEKIVVFEDKMIIVGLLGGSEIEVLIK
jgi:hypothetical protein